MARPEMTGQKIGAKVGATALKGWFDPNASPPPLAFSIRQFCTLHNISLDMFFKMRRLGTGPRVMKVGSRTLISCEAAAEWRRACEAASAA